MRILKPEKWLLEFVKKHILVIGLVVAVLASLLVRFLLRSFLTGDMRVFLIPWFKALREGGLRAAFAVPNNNYNVAYLLLLWPATLLPFTEIVCVKIVSIVFDYLVAGAMAWGILQFVPAQAANRKLIAIGTFIGTLFLPIPLANSAIWGQCDIIYTFFLLLCLLSLHKEKYMTAYIMFALSVCFKLQAVFFLPLIIILYVLRRSFSLLPILLSPLFLFLFGLLGRTKSDSIFFGFTVYLNQTQNDKRLYVDYPNIFTAFGAGDFDHIAPPAIVFTLAVFACMLVYLVYRNLQLKGDSIILMAVWCIMTCTVLLPSMHDRYGFAAELFIWLFFMAKPSLKRLGLALLQNFIPIIVYVRVFLEKGYLTQMSMSLVNVAVYLLISVVVILYLRKLNAPGQQQQAVAGFAAT